MFVGAEEGAFRDSTRRTTSLDAAFRSVFLVPCRDAIYSHPRDRVPATERVRRAASFTNNGVRANTRKIITNTRTGVKSLEIVPLMVVVKRKERWSAL